MDFSATEKKALIKITTDVIKVDGIIHPKEVHFFEQLKVLLGFDIPAVEDAEELDKAEALVTLSAMPYSKKKTLMTILTDAAKVDGAVHEKEMMFIIDTLKNIGLRKPVQE